MIENNPKNSEYYRLRGDAYYEMKDYNKALKDYNKLLILDSNLTIYYEKRGLIHY